MPRAKTLGCTPGSMVKEGYYFGVPPLALGGFSFLLHWHVAAAALVLFAAVVFSFFRDPERMIPTAPGSRVDVWVPKEAEILVKLGENVKGGSSVLARWPAKAAAAKLNGIDTAETETNLTATGKRS